MFFMSITREEVDVSERTLDALAVICSAHPIHTYYPQVRNQLHELTQYEIRNFFYFNRFGCSSDIDAGVSVLVINGCLTSCSHNLYRTNQMLYNQLHRIVKQKNYFSDDEKEKLIEIGRQLKIHDFYSRTALKI